MRYEFDVNKIDLVDLDGHDWKNSFPDDKPFNKYIGSSVYNQTRDIELDDKCKAIYRGEKVEFNDREKELFESAIKELGISPGLIERRVLQQIVKRVTER